MRYILCTVAFSATALAVPVLLVPPNNDPFRSTLGDKIIPPLHSNYAHLETRTFAPVIQWLGQRLGPKCEMVGLCRPVANTCETCESEGQTGSSTSVSVGSNVGVGLPNEDCEGSGDVIIPSSGSTPDTVRLEIPLTFKHMTIDSQPHCQEISQEVIERYLVANEGSRKF